MRKDTVTPSRAIYTEAHYAILYAFEISQVSIDKTKHNASSILPKVEPVLPDSAAKIRTISGTAKYYGSFFVTQIAQISQIICSIGWTRMGTDIVNDKRSELTTTNLELTTTWTTKTTQPLATLSPLDVVYVVYVVVKLGVRRTKENLCYLCDKEYPDDGITYWCLFPEKGGCKLRER